VTSTYAKVEVVEVWTGAAIGSPFPPPPNAVWERARVVEVREDAVQIEWLSNRPGMPVLPPAAVRKML
jgi:hypothetical protein